MTCDLNSQLGVKPGNTDSDPMRGAGVNTFLLPDAERD